jgi:hypothetical protein
MIATTGNVIGCHYTSECGFYEAVTGRRKSLGGLGGIFRYMGYAAYYTNTDKAVSVLRRDDISGGDKVSALRGVSKY